MIAKAGRKGKYEYWLTCDGLTLIEGWARDGLTDEQISHNMDIAYSTFRIWKDKFSALSAALKKNKEIVDYEVENALLKRAKGFEYEEKTYERVWNDKVGKYIKVNTKTVGKMVTPDTGAAAFWLKNRQSKKWRDKPEEEGGGESVVIIDDF